jgi:prepilin-type N-terminal cleavage/methylation domain-containing protein
MSPATKHDRGCARPGFSLLELMVAMVLASIVLIGVLGMMTVENKRLSVQKELGDAWLTLRSATELIAYDLRQASPSDDDLSPPSGFIELTDTSFTVRTRRGSGIICNRVLNQQIYALADVSGEFAAGDSVQVMTVADSPTWKTLRADAIGDPGGVVGGVVVPASCAWSIATTSEKGIRLLGDAASVAVGSPVHAFSSTQYGIMTCNNRRWLVRRVAGTGSPGCQPNWEILTGPLRTDGLRLDWRNAGGASTKDPQQVASVWLTLRGESYGRTNMRTTMSDTLTVRIHLRNSK